MSETHCGVHLLVAQGTSIEQMILLLVPRATRTSSKGAACRLMIRVTMWYQQERCYGYILCLDINRVRLALSCCCCARCHCFSRWHRLKRWNCRNCFHKNTLMHVTYNQTDAHHLLQLKTDVIRFTEGTAYTSNVRSSRSRTRSIWKSNADLIWVSYIWYSYAWWHDEPKRLSFLILSQWLIHVMINQHEPCLIVLYYII